MRIILIMIVLAFSCNNSNDTYKNYSNQIEHNIKVLEAKIASIKSRIKHVTYEYPSLPIGEYWYKKSVFVSQESNRIKTHLDSIISINNKNVYPLINFKEVKFLKEKMETFQETLINETKDEWFKKALKESFSTEEWQNINVLKSQKVTKNEFTAVFNKLKLDITFLEYLAQSFINPNIVDCSGGWNKIDPFIIPKSGIIQKGDTYEADILIAAYDTTMILNIDIDGKKYDSNSGITNYKHEVSEEPGLVKKTGKLILKNPKTGKDSIVPFVIKYEVIP